MRITLVQTDLVWENKVRNLAAIERLLKQQEELADVYLLPEMFSTGFSMQPDGLAEPMNGETVTWMHHLAAEKQALVAGSLIIRENGHYYNRFIAMGPDGLVAVYDKRHLFRMSGEEQHYQSGHQRIVFEWKGWKILPQICYDLRFPVWIRNRQDYDLILFVANWPEPRRDVWLTLLKARALENQAYVAAVNRTGRDGKGILHVGDSQIIDPKGRVLSEGGGLDGLVTASLDRDELLRFRDKFPVHLDQDNFELHP